MMIRNIRKILFSVLAFVFFTAGVSFAAVKDDPVMIKGIRPMGMGGAFTAVADDENAFFYNPAGIAQRTGSLFQIFNVNAAVNSDTIQAGEDLSNTFNDFENSDNAIDGLIKVKDLIADKDLDFTLSLFNPAYISGPLSLGSKGNTLSFGAGLFNSINVGVRAGMEIPRFMLDVVKLATEQNLDEKAFVNAISDTLLNMPDILQSGKTAEDVKAAIRAGADWSEIASTYLSNDLIDLIDHITYVVSASNEDDGDKYNEIVDELNNFKGGVWSQIVSGTSASATVNAYASATFDIPVAYKIKSLEALRIPGELSIGANLKYINRVKFSQTVIIGQSEIQQLLNGTDIDDVINTRVGAAYGQGFGLDLGMMYSYSSRLHFGLQVSDIYTNVDYNRGFSLNKDNYPDEDFIHEAYIAPQFNIGASYIPGSILSWNTKNRLMFAADIRDIFGSYQNSFKNKLHMGAEYRLGCLALRAGLNKLRPSAGLGLEFSGFQLSYAYYGEESYLAKLLDDADKTVYYHEFLLAFKVGHLKGRKVENGSKKTLRAEIEEIPAKTETPVVPAETESAESVEKTDNIQALEPAKSEALLSDTVNTTAVKETEVPVLPAETEIKEGK